MIAIAFALVAVLAAFLAGLLFGFIAGARYHGGGYTDGGFVDADAATAALFEGAPGNEQDAAPACMKENRSE